MNPKFKSIEETNERQLKLIREVKMGNQKALEHLIDLYNPLFKTLLIKAKLDFPSIPLDSNDIKQELEVSFWKLIVNYDIKSEKTFPSYIKTFLRWSLTTCLRKYVTNGHKMSNFANDYFDDYHPIEDNIIQEDFTFLKEYLDSKEYKLLNYMLEGLTINEISSIMNVSVNSLYNKKSKLILKLREINQEVKFI